MSEVPSPHEFREARAGSNDRPDEEPGGVQAQLGAARNDPRLTRTRSAPIADFFDHLAEAERVRALHIWSVQDARQVLARQEERLETRRGSLALTPDAAAELDAAWERAELANAEVANDFPLINAMTLIGLHGALDALVEELTPSANTMTLDLIVKDVINNARLQHPDLTASFPPEILQAVQAALRDVLAEELPRISRPAGSGAERWESVLRKGGLAAPPTQPIPPDLDEALRELSNLRDVLVHRAGRLDRKAIQACPSLVARLYLAEGQLVRLRGIHYRRYSAAVRAYGLEITRRTLTRGGIDNPVDLANWQDFYIVGP